MAKLSCNKCGHRWYSRGGVDDRCPACNRRHPRKRILVATCPTCEIMWEARTRYPKRCIDCDSGRGTSPKPVVRAVPPGTWQPEILK